MLPQQCWQFCPTPADRSEPYDQPGIQELAALIEDLVGRGRDGGLSDEEIATQLQDAVDALIQGMP